MRASFSPARLRRAVSLLLALLLLWACSVPALAEGETAKKPWRGITYIVTRMGDDPIVIDGSSEPDLTGYPLAYRDNGRFRDLAIAARQNLILRHHGQVYTLEETDLTPFPDLFERLGFSFSLLEAVHVDVFRGRVEVTVSTDVSYCERDAEVTPYQTVRRPNPNMKQGEEDVVQVGAVGEKGGVYEVFWSHGAVVGRQLVEELNSEPVDEIVEYGTAKASKVPRPAAQSVSVSRDEGGGGVLTLPDGGTLRFTRAVSMTATAYTSGHGGVGTRTASGTPVRVGVAAVDRKVIPLGTKLYVVANGGVVYGEAVAEDTGVRGNRIDLYFDTYQECLSFGRRDCMVYILE